tara:strand:+ start:6728 stop:7378 length:651 start_codon:yes stop_codon:yes gene_type:complete
MEQVIDLNLRNVQYPNNKLFSEIVESWCKKKQIKGEEELKIWKNKNGFDDDQWNDYITREWRWTIWCMDKFSEKIPNYYLKKKSMLDRVEYSLIRVSSENLANELFLRIKEKESTFEEIAKKYSEGPEKQTCGIVGPDQIWKAHPILAKLLKISEKGQLWSPRKFDKWWIIVRLNYIQNTPLDKSLFKELALELGLKFIEESIKDKSYEELNQLLE